LIREFIDPIGRIKEVSLQEEESPIIFLNQPSPNLTTSADEEEKA
jgi:hypothetical protein